MSSSDQKTQIKSHVETLCRKVIKEKGWRPFNDLVVEVQPMLSSFGAFITLDERKIHVQTGEDLYEAVDSMIKDEKLTLSRDEVLERIMYLIMVHEYGHHQYCPRTNENFASILEGSFKAIEGREYRQERIIQLCLELHNMFSDTILNTINAQIDPDAKKYREGLDLAYLLMSHYNKKMQGQRADKAHTLFLQTNKFLCSNDPKIEEKMGKYYARFFWGRQRYLRKTIDVFTGNENLTNAVLNRDMNDQAVSDLIGRINDSSLWNGMSYDYTNIMYSFLKQKNNWLQNSFSRSKEEKESQNGQDQKKQDQKKQDQDNSGQNSDQQKNPSQPKKGNTEKIGDKKEKKDSGEGNKEEKDKTEKDKTHSNGQMSKALEDFLRKLLEQRNKHTPLSSDFLNYFERLNSLYTERASRVELFVEGNKQDDPQYEHLMGKEEMPLEEFNSRGIDWASTRIITSAEGGKNVELFRKDTPLILPFKSDELPGGIPDLSFILDSSGSMDFDPFNGDGYGKYHFASLGFYSILKFLEEIGLAPLLNYHLINFSDTTVSSGWRSYSEIMLVKQALFDYQGRGTFLDPQSIRDLKMKRKDNFICFMLADGEFNSNDNQKEIIKEIEEMRGIGGAGFYLFQIGGHSAFSQELENRGFQVKLIRGAEDFMNLSIRFTRDFYGEVAKNVDNL